MSTLKVNFVASDRTLWEGEASYVSFTTVDGSMGVLPRMAPALAVLAEGPVEITELDGSKRAIRISGGFVSVDDSVVTVVADDVLEDEAA
ncbi:MAG: F0F1 ATP synthase subunit epsilon [Dermabacter sp.]|nr:F0F1 ATP synthase subunit epsilon [Dermabacter sp.]